MAARQGPAQDREEKRTPGPGQDVPLTSHPISQLHDDRQLREKNFLLLSRGVSPPPPEPESRMCARVGRRGRVGQTL